MKKSNLTLIIILNWNELKLTLRCVESLKSQLGNCAHILIVDNHSEDDPTDFIKQRHPYINIIRTKNNFGVAGGRNIGIQYALEFNYRYILFLDNDAYADSELINKLFSAAEDYPDTALFGPKIYYENRNQIIWRVGCTSWKWTYLHAGYVILNRFCHLLRKRPPAWIDTGRGENQIDCGQFDKIEEIDFQIGCAQFIRASVFNEIGLLDMDFCPYGSEDIDFCARLKNTAGRSNIFPMPFAGIDPRAVLMTVTIGLFTTCVTYSSLHENTSNPSIFPLYSSRTLFS